MATDAELLTAARTALKNRLDGDAFESYSTGPRSFRGATVMELQALIEKLERRANRPDSAVLVQHIDV